MRNVERFKALLGMTFAALFLALSVGLMCVALIEFATTIRASDEPITAFIRSLNTLFVALATFELGVGISKEYTQRAINDDIFVAVRRTIVRFVSVTSIALVLEGLVMVIKYSQLDLAGNLYYPVAIILSAAGLLLAMGGFLALTRPDAHRQSSAA